MANSRTIPALDQPGDKRLQSRAVVRFTVTVFVVTVALLFVLGQEAGFYWPMLGLNHRISGIGQYAAAYLALAGPILTAAVFLIFLGAVAARGLGSIAGYATVLIAAAAFFGFLTIDLWTQRVFGAHARQYVPDLLDAARAGKGANQFDFAGDRQAIQSEIINRLVFVFAVGLVTLYFANVTARLAMRRRGIGFTKKTTKLIFALIAFTAVISIPVVANSDRTSAVGLIVNQLPYSIVSPHGTGSSSGSTAPVVRIAALLPDPYGDDTGREEIQLQGREAGQNDLTGWVLENSRGQRFQLSGTVSGRDISKITIGSEQEFDDTPRSANSGKIVEKDGLFKNDGDTIHLLNQDGRLVDSIRYTPSDVHRGSLITAVEQKSSPGAVAIEAQMKHGFETISSAIKSAVPNDTAAKLEGSDRPNVVYLIMESFRFDGLKDMMPQISAARKRGLDFNAHSSGTNTSHLGLFSLTYARSPLLYDSSIDAGVRPQVTATFRASGYQTAFYTSGDCTSWRKMGDFLNDKNFDDFYVFGSNNWMTWHGWPDSDKKMADRINNRLKSGTGQPQFIEAFFMSSHFPYSYPAEYEKNLPVGDTKRLFAAAGEETTEHLRNRYRNAMLYLDDLLTELINNIDLTKTIVVITGDHGESIWDDGTLTHGSRSSEFQSRAPLLILGRGVIPAVFDFPTTHLDLFPTVLHLAAGHHVEVGGIQGRDLLDPVLRQAAAAAGDPYLIIPYSVSQPVDLVLSIRGEKMLFHARLDRPELSAIGMLDQNGFLTGQAGPAGDAALWARGIDEIAGRFQR